MKPISGKNDADKFRLHLLVNLRTVELKSK